MKLLSQSIRKQPYPIEKVRERSEHIPDQEAREVLARELIDQYGHQVLDIGSGLSTLWMDGDAQRKYVEFDLPVASHLKQDVLSRVFGTDTVAADYPNLRFAAGNALVIDDLMRAVSQLDPTKPVTIYTGGLLHYLTKGETGQRDILASYIHTILSHTGGVWITDMPSWEGISDRDPGLARQTSVQTGRDVARNRFEDNATASAFFAKRGLVEAGRYRYADAVDRMQSPARLGLSPDAVRAKVSPWSLWTFQVPPRIKPH